MKLLRSVLVGVAVLVISICLSGVSFADGKHHGWKESGKDEEAKVKMMKDSAVALQTSNPELAKGLNDWAADEEKELQEAKAWKEKHDAKIKLLEDSSAALQKTNPDLSKGLKEMAEHQHKGKMQEMREEKNEKEEAGEMVEPKNEQHENKK